MADDYESEEKTDFEVDLTEEESEGELEAEEEAEGPFTYDETADNLVAQFMEHPDGVECLKKTAERVIDDFEADWASTEEYRDRMAKDLALFNGRLPKKQPPYEHTSNAHVPIMIENCTRLISRTYQELFGNWHEVFKVAPVGPDDRLHSEILTLHGNWQIREQLPDFKVQQMRGITAFYTIGDVVFHSHWDEVRRQNRHEVLTPDDFVMPYVYTSTCPDLSDVPHTTRIMNMYRHELERMKDVWFDVDKVLDGETPSWMDEPERRLAEAVSDVKGIYAPEDDKNAPFKILFYEGWLKLEGQDKERFCQVVVEPSSRAVLRLFIREEDDWQDKQRYEREMGDLTRFRAEEAMHADIVAQHQADVAMAQSAVAAAGMIGPEQHQLAMQQLSMLETAPLPPPPIAPPWMIDPTDPTEEPQKPKRVPVHTYTHIRCIEPLAGGLGISYGSIEANYNRAANVALSQVADAATLSNVSCWLSPDYVDIEDFRLAPGRVNKVHGLTAADIKEGLVQVKTAPPSPVLLDIVDRMVAYGQSAMQSNPVLSGEPGKSGETARGLNARLEQATKQVSVLAGVYREGLTRVLQMNAKLNSLFLREEEIYMVTNHLMIPQEIKVGRKMYDRDYRVEFLADLRFTSMEEKIAEADEVLFNIVLKTPLMSFPPVVDAAIRESLRARGRYDLIQLLPPPLDPNAPPPPGAPAPGGAPVGAAPVQGQPGPEPGGPESMNRPEAPPAPPAAA